MAESLKNPQVPRHMAIIMDGNGRWAKKRGLPRMAGHKVGADVFRKVARYCNAIGMEFLTVYAFSTENWKRPEKEVQSIMNLLREYLKDSKNYIKENIRLQFIGDRSMLAEDIIAQMAEAEQLSAKATGLTVNIAVNYGGRDELVRATKNLVQKVAAGQLTVDQIDEKALADCLDTANRPDPDVILRTGGELRLSNFLVWQAAYAELVSTDVLWPDIKEADIDQAIAAFANRSRRFGGV